MVSARSRVAWKSWWLMSSIAPASRKASRKTRCCSQCIASDDSSARSTMEQPARAAASKIAVSCSMLPLKLPPAAVRRQVAITRQSGCRCRKSLSGAAARWGVGRKSRRSSRNRPSASAFSATRIISPGVSAAMATQTLYPSVPSQGCDRSRSAIDFQGYGSRQTDANTGTPRSQVPTA